jgi:hypothetical protein
LFTLLTFLFLLSSPKYKIGSMVEEVVYLIDARLIRDLLDKPSLSTPSRVQHSVKELARLARPLGSKFDCEVVSDDRIAGLPARLP